MGQIIPWNFPLLMQAWKLAPALACGCCCVMKLSEKTPLTGLMFGELVKEAGFPPGVVNILNGFGPTCGEAISRHMDIDKVCFTGSSVTGPKVMIGAAESNMKRVSFEMGGKSPLIVFPDANIDQAIQAAQIGLFFNTGQCCIAGSRIYVHEDIYEKFIIKSVEAANKHKVGDPLNKDNFLGPIVDDIQFKRVMNYIDIGKNDGAKLMCGGKRMGRKGYYIEPTVFADVKDNMRIAKEEIFGPVMSILKFRYVEGDRARQQQHVRSGSWGVH